MGDRSAMECDRFSGGGESLAQAEARERVERVAGRSGSIDKVKTMWNAPRINRGKRYSKLDKCFGRSRRLKN
jgi:hypothetical protein